MERPSVYEELFRRLQNKTIYCNIDLYVKAILPKASSASVSVSSAQSRL